MTISHKVTQMNTYAIAVPDLAIPRYQWWSESLHGVMFINGTSFPQSTTPIRPLAEWAYLVEWARAPGSRHRPRSVSS